jgi:hypothetical protein
MELPDFEQHFINPFMRIEPRCRADDFARGVEARIADPLWMLARQWQTGEFQGEDAGSPIHVQLRHSTQQVNDLRLGSGNTIPQGTRPLETAVEEEDPIIDFRERVRIGLEFERRLLAQLSGEAGAEVARAVVVGVRNSYAFPQHSGSGGPGMLSNDEISRLDRATQRFIRFMQGRMVDGISVLHDVTAPEGYEIHQPTLDQIVDEISTWRSSVCSISDNPQSPAWQGSRLDYRFELHTDAQTQPQASAKQTLRTDSLSLASTSELKALQANEIAEGSELAGFAICGITLRGATRGNYTFRQDGPTAGKVTLLRDGVELLQVNYSWQTTISFDNPYRFSFPGYFDIEIGKQGSGTRNLYGLNNSFFDGNQALLVQDVMPAQEITEGSELGGFAICGIEIRGAPLGNYTFRQDGPTAGTVRLLCDGVEVAHVDYNWRTTISFDNPYRFSFPGYFDIEIGKQGNGTRNLHGLDNSFFDGHQVLRIQTPARTHLTAPDYRNGEIDWYTFDTLSTGDGGWQSAEKLETTPTRLSFANTSPRWWAFEDGRTYFGGLDVNRPDLAKLLLMEMVLIYADDWFSVPVQVDMGRLARITELVVTNVFGDREKIEPARKTDGSPTERFELYTLSPAGRQRDPGYGDFIFIPPVSGHRIESPPIDEVHFVRDEGANMVWGIEHLVPNGIGRPVSGFDAQLERIAIEREADLERLDGELAGLLSQLEEMSPGSNEREELEQQVRTLQGQITRLSVGALQPPSHTEIPSYRLATQVPENWIPFVPRARQSRLGARHPRIQFQRAQMLRYTDATEKIASQSRLLALNENPLLWLDEESVLRSGVRVQLTKQRVRWIDGSTHVWLGRKVLTGRGEGASGLKFDSVGGKRQ